jgi:hypothetical protein
MATATEIVESGGKGYRTFIFGALVSILGVVQGLNWVDVVHDPKVAGWIVAIIGLIVMVLRYFTDTPIGQTTPTTTIHH